MKRRTITIFLVAILSILTLFAFCGCSGKGATSNNNQPNNNQVDNIQSNDNWQNGNQSNDNQSNDNQENEIDVDLTKLNSIMVYSEVSQMMFYPDKYVGKTIKMKGTFSALVSPERNYYACIIEDATACCAQGIEFVWAGTHSYPNDYPENGTTITVVGTFDTYYEDSNRYCQLINAEVEF